MIPTILLVDDVSMFLELQKTFLKFSSVHVLTAKDGAGALQMVRKERPSLVFMDLHMPIMDGAECCARIKADTEFKSLPVVMITSEGKGEERKVCYSAGCDDFLTKPLDRNLFLKTARKYLPAIDRRDSRIPFRANVKFRAFGFTLSAEIFDISRNGIFIATDYEVAIGTVLEIVFPLQGESGSLIQAKGKVAWLNGRIARKKTVLPVGFGVEFIALAEKSEKELKYLIERQT
jgi:CheY-like chemotaxis protein/Tfp pilus assembly protein PilZ